MNKTYRTTGIVINKRDWRENDSLFTIITFDYGKIKVIATGSKKIKSKLMGHLSSLGLVDIMVAKGKQQDRLATARLIDNFQIDLEKDYIYISYFFELLDKLLEEGQPDKDVWNVLLKSIKWLQSSSNKIQKKIVVTYFTFQLFKNLGYHPELYNCIKCNNKVQEKIYFSFSENGLCCDKCQIDKLKVEENVVKLIRILISDKVDNFDNLVIKQKYIDELGFFIDKWVTYIAERKINSFHYLLK
jgi:DNA repair protein RecO (recombination protein O)